MARVTVEDCLDNVDNRFELGALSGQTRASTQHWRQRPTR
jgi:DNA-directed RNA polymerase subunit K/omega